MEHEFWHNKWHSNEIGFHLNAPNQLLTDYFSELNLAPGSTVFLPLCGKTLDIPWLIAQGYKVVGVELSAIAVDALFESMNLVPKIITIGNLQLYSSDGIDVFVGDFFELTIEDLGVIDAIYDRAALIALPQELRDRYAEQMSKLTRMAPQLLITLEYDQTLAKGPPFSLSETDVIAYYGDRYNCHTLAIQEMSDGLKGKWPAKERVWWLTKKVTKRID